MIRASFFAMGEGRGKPEKRKAGENSLSVMLLFWCEMNFFARMACEKVKF